MRECDFDPHTLHTLKVTLSISGIIIKDQDLERNAKKGMKRIQLFIPDIFTIYTRK